MDNYEKDLTRLRKSKEWLLNDYHRLFQDYVRALGEIEVKSEEISEVFTGLGEQTEKWNAKEQEYIDRANAVAAEQMEMAIKIKHLERELSMWEKGKKKYKPAPKKKVIEEE